MCIILDKFLFLPLLSLPVKLSRDLLKENVESETKAREKGGEAKSERTEH